MGLLDGLFDKNKKGGNEGGIPNPFANRGGRSFHGQGQSLGGSKPGTVIPISLARPGPLGVRVEKRPNSEGTAIVNEVVPGSQAEEAGMKRGDILCFAGSDGQEEMMYDMFLELAKSPQRPLELEVRRITTAAAKQNPVVKPSQNRKSAEADHRRQAVIAAAEAREKKHKAKSKPIKQVTKTTLARERQLQQQNQQSDAPSEPLSEEARRAAAAAKQGEAVLAHQLGYNPYETARATAGQARTATTTAQHGTIDAGATGDHLPTVAPPAQVAVSTDDDEHPSEEFSEALATMLSSGDVSKTKGIMKKLLVNATTKGQAPGEEAAKFRRVRLANPKIKAALVDVPGAVEVLLSAGFSLEEQEGESLLVYPFGTQGPDWLPAALLQLETSN